MSRGIPPWVPVMEDLCILPTWEAFENARLACKPTLVADEGISKPYVGVHMEVSCQTLT